MTDFNDDTMGFAGFAIFNVKHSDYGAEGDGSTDDAAAIQVAIDDAEAAGGGIVYFPPGTYVLGTPAGATTGWLEIDRDLVWLRGSGMGKTTLSSDSTTQSAIQ